MASHFPCPPSDETSPSLNQSGVRGHPPGPQVRDCHMGSLCAQMSTDNSHTAQRRQHPPADDIGTETRRLSRSASGSDGERALDVGSRALALQPLQVAGVGIAVDRRPAVSARLLVDRPDDSIVPAGGDRLAHTEGHALLEGGSEQPHRALPLLVVRHVGFAPRARVRHARVGMLRELHARREVVINLDGADARVAVAVEALEVCGHRARGLRAGQPVRGAADGARALGLERRLERRHVESARDSVRVARQPHHRLAVLAELAEHDRVGRACLPLPRHELRPPRQRGEIEAAARSRNKGELPRELVARASAGRRAGAALTDGPPGVCARVDLC
mmetsp:Transcript_11166/g.29548  ORF Transcript_11166/g.29548 Transcript_11166/m.29548 type:complete len:333 (-) Transcript_11166:1483-2481(-)